MDTDTESLFASLKNDAQEHKNKFLQLKTNYDQLLVEKTEAWTQIGSLKREKKDLNNQIKVN